mgnify:CR=1 FL=1
MEYARGIISNAAKAGIASVKSLHSISLALLLIIIQPTINNAGAVANENWWGYFDSLKMQKQMTAFGTIEQILGMLPMCFAQKEWQ